MAARPSISDILALSMAERIRLVQTIWDSIAEFPEAVELMDAQRRELDRRLDAYRDAPAVGSPWNIVKARIGRTDLASNLTRTPAVCETALP